MRTKILTLAILATSLFTYSCRETTGDKVGDAIEAAAEDTENNLEKAGDAIENAGNEIQEEVRGTDDINGNDD